MFYVHKTENKILYLWKYRRCIFGGNEAPAGALLVAPSLESTCFMYLRHKNQDSLFSEIQRLLF